MRLSYINKAISASRVRRERIVAAFKESSSNNLTTLFRRDPQFGSLVLPSADNFDRGAVAGNGVKMAAEKKLKKTKRRGTANLTNVKKPCAKPSRSVKKSTAEKSKREADYEALDLSDSGKDEVDAEDVISTKLNRVLVERSSYIAKKLAQRAEEGSVTGANLVLELVRRKKEGKKLSSKRLIGLVAKLESEPDEAKQETQSAVKA